MRPALLIATSNPGKASEFRTLLSEDTPVLSLLDIDINVDVVMPEEIEETFQGNAELKAVSVAAQTGMITLADDSGLVVDALDGQPGVRSARYAGVNAGDAENRRKLLDALKDVPPSDRGAHFVCTVAVATPSGNVWTETGILDGMIVDHARGESGFGYDRLFETADGRTLAELSPTEKHAISHRGEAIRRALPRIEIMLEEIMHQRRDVSLPVPSS